jgi:osmotically-inducible protein OsmY
LIVTITTLTRTDHAIREGVERQLEWDSRVDASAIGVAVKDGAVTLTGFIDSYAGKLAAERAAKRMRGVRAVANDIQVRLRLERTDEDLARDAAQALMLRASLPESVQAVVHNGHITLTGIVEALFQQSVAEKAVRHIRGVKHVVNRIQVRPESAMSDVRRAIVRTLRRDADIDARGINVEVDGSTVTLTGTVKSWHERESAERAAAHARAVTQVNNKIEVAWPEELADEIC